MLLMNIGQISRGGFLEELRAWPKRRLDDLRRRPGRIALTLHTLLRDRSLDIYEDEELIDELMNVRLEEGSPGVYTIDPQSGAHDDRVISLALAATELVSRSSRPRIDARALEKALALGNAELVKAPATPNSHRSIMERG